MRVIFSNEIKPFLGPAIFIDRDGVVNCRKPGDYVRDWSQFEFIDGIQTALRELSTLNLPMIMISNQAGVGKGLVPPAALEEITARMNESLQAQGVRLTAAYFCTHTPADLCSCRKPRPDLLLRAAADFTIDLAHSIFIGDSDTDVQAARAAGCRPVLFGTGLASSSKSNTWMDRLPIAATAKELFHVSVGALKSNNSSVAR